MPTIVLFVWMEFYIGWNKTHVFRKELCDMYCLEQDCINTIVFHEYENWIVALTCAVPTQFYLVSNYTWMRDSLNIR